ncbi:hypothetical protein DRQ11_14090 [candidate division KSB1 bacterium]|nr:MAG: hypothetical protein DRQ11_14090 [candidate division KSB1 bacterium]
MNKKMLPTIALGNYSVSRLIIGHNPFKGNSHFSEVMDRDMREYFSQERMIETLFECEPQGPETHCYAIPRRPRGYGYGR